MSASEKPQPDPSPLDTLPWDRLQALFKQAINLPTSERTRFLDKACADEPKLRRELDTLLEISDQTSPANLSSESLASNLRILSSTAGLRKGQTISHYKILEKLGGGGMGLVFKAEDQKLKRQVALKFLPLHLSQDEDIKQRFMREARAASALDHPNICTIFEIGELEDGPCYIAMAYYEGDTIKQLIEKGPMDSEKAINLTLQVCNGLVQAHARGIVHRDIKPANLMLTQDGMVKILDFGVAKIDDTSLTKTGATVGTASYMSPEQASGEPVDHRSDIWSVGVVLYEMLTGQRPFTGDHTHAVMYSILHRNPQPVTGLRAGIPMRLAHVLHKILAKSPEQRYQRLENLTADLEAILNRNASRISAEKKVMQESSGEIEIVPQSPSDAAQGFLKILIVDDEPEVELLLRRMFRRQAKANNWIFDFALNGKEALAKVLADPEIALVLTDLNMPEMDGLTLLDRLQTLKRPLKTVVVSAYSDMRNIRAAMNRGAFDFIIKPLDPGDLEATITKSHSEWKDAQRAKKNERQLVALQKELEVARQIQEAIQPLALAPHEAADIYAFSAAAHEISGTFYDYYLLDAQRIGFIMGDVGTKGVPAALFMAMVQTHLKSLALQGVDPGACLTSVNQLLIPDGFHDLAVTAIVGAVDTSSRMLVYSNAGHPTPYILTADGLAEPLSDRDDAQIWQGKHYAFTTFQYALHPQDTLLLYTQGITAAKNAQGLSFSNERLAQLITEQRGKPAAEIIRHLMRAAMQHAEDTPLTEDLTLMAARLL